jgi:hypothetical protein
MGNHLYTNVAYAMGKLQQEMPVDFNPTTGTIDGVSNRCVDTFQGYGGKDYASIAFKVGAIASTAVTDYNMAMAEKSFAKRLKCEVSGDEENLLKCDWSNLYEGIIAECKVINARGFAVGTLNQYYEGNCKEILGITDEMLADGVFNPETEWCPAYYGKEGKVTFASVEVTREIGVVNYDDEMVLPLDQVLNSTFGVGVMRKVTIENVPYCTAFDECTESEFFTMANLEAAAYADSYEGFSEFKIIHGGSDEATCTDSELKFKVKNMKKACKWATMGNSSKRCKTSIKKHCPVACDACDEFKCVDSTREFWVTDAEPKQWGNCNLVKENPEYCYTSGVKSVCRETCGFCD